MEIFDGQAAEYDAWYSTPEGRRLDALEKTAVWRAVRPKAGETALDVGCGTGNYSLALARRGLTVTGVDVSTDMLAAAERKARGLESVKFMRADATALPFAPESFDLVLSVTAFEFVKDPARAVSECWRVLRPGGRLVVAWIAGSGAWANLYEKAAAADENSVFQRARFWTVAEARKWLPGISPRIRGALWTPPLWLGKGTWGRFWIASVAERIGRVIWVVLRRSPGGNDSDSAGCGWRQSFCPGFVVVRWDKKGER